MRLAITKGTANGEQVVVDIAQWNPVNGQIMHPDVQDMYKMLDGALAHVDLRMQEMNLRMLEAYSVEQYCTPDVWQKIVSVLDIIAGRVNAATVVQRWADTDEENIALQTARAEYEEALANGTFEPYNGNNV